MRLLPRLAPPSLLALPLALVLLGSSVVTEEPAPRKVEVNENRDPAGRMRGNVLRVHLEVRMARWYPEADNGPFTDVAVFAERGRAPRVPGPLIRVKTGTVVEATLTNSLSDSTITLFGFQTRPVALADSVRLAPGESRTMRFAAGHPGTYLYTASLGNYRPPRLPLEQDAREREQLAGAFIIDPTSPARPDRIMVINSWRDPKDSTEHQTALTINGKSWPYTERIGTTVGDTLRWRVINASGRAHPMHLHGFYFSVDARGSIHSDSLYTADQRRLVVTEGVPAGATMAMTWTPDRPGNWLFHCHIGFHVIPEIRFNAPPPRHSSNYAHNAENHMAGLVMGIIVKPDRSWRAPAEGPSRRMRLFVQEGWRRGRAPRSLAFVLQRGDREPAPDSVELPGSPLILTRGEPTDITVINRLAEPTGVHWHGIELESYSDGVVGWSGMGNRLAPLIAPRDSFTAHLTLPRAGTFIYHTHLNDLEQLTSGLYGGIIVLEPGMRFDPATDHLYVAGWDGAERIPHLLVNGDSLPKPMKLASGVAHRFRFVNIGVAGGIRYSLLRDSTVVQWKALAKDGADLPPAQRITRRAMQALSVGETYDFELAPPEPGRYTLVTESILASRRGSRLEQRIDLR
ncbi:MAG TPA: multicopper oxidase domain-containing protein [Gemmatimonadaceae bacterium]|nr:multicopper oxidase domain-containing protein [Gemmatimonadaceae bacterium]